MNRNRIASNVMLPAAVLAGLLFCCPVQALSTVSPRVELKDGAVVLDAQGDSLVEIIQKISEFAGVTIYLFDRVSGERRFLSLERASVEELLESVLKGFNHAVIYTEQNAVVLSEEKGTRSLVFYDDPAGAESQPRAARTRTSRTQSPSQAAPGGDSGYGTGGVGGAAGPKEAVAGPDAGRVAGSPGGSGGVVFFAASGESEPGPGPADAIRQPENVAREHGVQAWEADYMTVEEKRIRLRIWRLENLVESGMADSHHDRWKFKGEPFVKHPEKEIEELKDKLASMDYKY